MRHTTLTASLAATPQGDSLSDEPRSSGPEALATPAKPADETALRSDEAADARQLSKMFSTLRANILSTR